jgi:hypothetical protein
MPGWPNWATIVVTLLIEPLPRGSHRRGELGDQEERHLDVHAVDAVEVGLGVRGGGAEREDAGVVDQDVDVAAAELDGLAGQLAHAGLAGQGGGDEVGLAAG